MIGGSHALRVIFQQKNIALLSPTPQPIKDVDFSDRAAVSLSLFSTLHLKRQPPHSLYHHVQERFDHL